MCKKPKATKPKKRATFYKTICKHNTRNVDVDKLFGKPLKTEKMK